MQLKSIAKTLASLAAILGIAANADAQTYRLPGEHTDQHRDLIAGQVNINNQIKVETTQQFLDNLFENEEEPEMDIYTEGWDSKLVNAYAGMDVPDTHTIDVSYEKFRKVPVDGFQIVGVTYDDIIPIASALEVGQAHTTVKCSAYGIADIELQVDSLVHAAETFAVAVW